MRSNVFKKIYYCAADVNVFVSTNLSLIQNSYFFLLEWDKSIFYKLADIYSSISRWKHTCSIGEYITIKC